MLDEDRATLLASQAELLAALTGRGARSSPLHRFDGRALETAAAALANKRAREVAKAWPDIQRLLGSKMPSQFAAYAAATPLPSYGGPLADGRAFAQRLLAAGLTSDQLRLAMLAVDLRFATHPSGLTPRRGVALKWAFLRRPLRLVVGLRLPRGKVRTLVVLLNWR